MKYIKHFEQKDKVWLIRTDEPYFSVSLDKLGLKIKEETKKHMMKHKYDKIYIKIDSSGTHRQPWGWSDDYEIFTKRNIKNMGEIELTDDEINDFLIKQNMNKYNL